MSYETATPKRKTVKSLPKLHGKILESVCCGEVMVFHSAPNEGTAGGEKHLSHPQEKRIVPFKTPQACDNLDAQPSLVGKFYLILLQQRQPFVQDVLHF